MKEIVIPNKLFLLLKGSISVIIISLLMHVNSNAQNLTPEAYLNKNDLSFLKELTDTVFESSRIYPHQSITKNSGQNNTGGILIRPGGRDSYPAFWIRDYAMSLESGFVTLEEQKHMLFLTASTQCDQTWISKNGGMIPYGAIADHIRIDDALPIYFPGTYSYEDQGDKTWGKTPPYSDQFFFIHMAWYYLNSGVEKDMLLKEINGMTLIDRLELAFKVPPSGLNNLVYTTSNFRGVDFGFRDVIEITGYLCFPSILKYRAANELVDFYKILDKPKKVTHYKNIAASIKKNIPEVFMDKHGLVKSSTGKSQQYDVWSTALAIYLNVLDAESLQTSCTALTQAYKKGTLSFKGNIRHVLTTDDFNENSAWEYSEAKKNTYQNGAYWGTATGWVCYAIAQVDKNSAKRLASEYIDNLRDTDFRKGDEFGGPYECFHPETGNLQNPVYLTTVSCPYSIFKNVMK